MKVQLIRKSMNPVEAYKLTEMVDEYKKRYDILLEKYGTDMKEMHENLEPMIESLMNDYEDDLSLTVTLPTSGPQWKKLINKYDCTITLGTNIETEKLMLIIMDEDDTGISV